jgi:hypothetical protein
MNTLSKLIASLAALIAALALAWSAWQGVTLNTSTHHTLTLVGPTALDALTKHYQPIKIGHEQ